ncbi:hypothetical protein B0H16DRAFT_1894437 [Mycena metata]|uniref:Uncharacterized protein n=1 Tax=Mycena metata TaxID=1033252 RepID=A0AAD7HSP2_9AGAR|nr:hypothetical protein B0H16DRAFT_1894437 [Mycena metata]
MEMSVSSRRQTHPPRAGLGAGPIRQLDSCFGYTAPGATLLDPRTYPHTTPLLQTRTQRVIRRTTATAVLLRLLDTSRDTLAITQITTSRHFIRSEYSRIRRHDGHPPLVNRSSVIDIDGMRLVVLGGTIETARRVSSSAIFPDGALLRRGPPVRLVYVGALETVRTRPTFPFTSYSFRSYTSIRLPIPFREHPRVLSLHFFATFRIPPYTFLRILVHLPASPCPPAPQLATYHPNSLPPPSRAHSPRLPLPTYHIHPASLLAHTLPPYSLPTSTSASPAHTRAILPLSFPPLLSTPILPILPSHLLLLPPLPLRLL